MANQGDNTVSRMSANTGEQTGTFNLGAGPMGVSVGGGHVWVASSVDGTVTRFDPHSGSSATILVGHGPSGIAYGEGAVWVANAKDGTVSRIDPTTSNVRTIKVGNSPIGIAVGAGRVWFSVQAP